MLDAYVFVDLDEVRQNWIRTNNEERLHDAPGNLPPAL
jgi:hypothetical protein